MPDMSAIENTPEISFIDNKTVEDVRGEMVADYEDYMTQAQGVSVSLDRASVHRMILYAAAAQIYQAMQYIDRQGKQSLLKYSYSDYLDNLALFKGVTRSPATAATCTLGAQIPMLAAIQNMLPALALPFSVVILLGVFTTITGYLWAVGRRFAEDRTKKQAVVVVITAVLGVSVASVIPLDKLVNFIYPLIGAAGLVIFVGIVIKLVTESRAPAAENK